MKTVINKTEQKLAQKRKAALVGFNRLTAKYNAVTVRIDRVHTGVALCGRRLRLAIQMQAAMRKLAKAMCAHLAFGEKCDRIWLKRNSK